MRDNSKSQTSLSRRQFATVAGVAVVASGTPSVAMASGSPAIGEVTERLVSLSTPKGAVDGFFVHPAEGKHPGVIAWRGQTGLNVSSRAQARRLATQGYCVLVLDRDSADGAPVESDTAGAMAWLTLQDNVDEQRVGTPEWAEARLLPQRRY
jgi:hypothetical protein